MELDFIYAFISQIKDDDKELERYSLTLSELGEKLNKRLQLRDVEYLFDTLIKKSFKVHNSRELAVYSFFSTLSFNKEENRLTVKFNEDLKPHLLQLKTYAKGNFRYLLEYKSEYTKRIYMLLCQWRTATKCTYSVEQIMEILDIPKSYRYPDFKRRVLERAQEEIQKSGDICFTYEELKQGKKVTDIFFRVYTVGGKDRTKVEVTFEHYKLKSIYFEGEDREILNVWQSKEHKDYVFVQLQAIDKSTMTAELHITALDNAIAYHEAKHPKLL